MSISFEAAGAGMFDGYRSARVDVLLMTVPAPHMLAVAAALVAWCRYMHVRIWRIASTILGASSVNRCA